MTPAERAICALRPRFFCELCPPESADVVWEVRVKEVYDPVRRLCPGDPPSEEEVEQRLADWDAVDPWCTADRAEVMRQALAWVAAGAPPAVARRVLEWLPSNVDGD